MRKIVESEQNFRVLFLDISKVFNTLISRWMLFTLKELFVPDHLVKLIKAIYETTAKIVKRLKNTELAGLPMYSKTTVIVLHSGPRLNDETATD